MGIAWSSAGLLVALLVVLVVVLTAWFSKSPGVDPLDFCWFYLQQKRPREIAVFPAGKYGFSRWVLWRVRVVGLGLQKMAPQDWEKEK